jgi:hypothetical protein
MTHPALKSFKLLNASRVESLAGYDRILETGGMLYRDENGVEQSPWVGGVWGEDRTGAPAAPWSNRWQTFDRVRLEKFADSVTARVLMLDIEHYADDQLGKLVDLIETIRSFRPDIAIGVWSILPASDWWTVQNFAQYLDFRNGHPHFVMSSQWWHHPNVGKKYEAAYAKWQARNRLAAAKLVPHVDYLAPSIYPARDIDAENLAWELARNAELVIDEAISLAQGKPVLPVYYPWVSASRTPASEALTAAIAGACVKADGLVLWSDGNTPEAAVRKHAAILRDETATAGRVE